MNYKILTTASPPEEAKIGDLFRFFIQFYSDDAEPVEVKDEVCIKVADKVTVDETYVCMSGTVVSVKPGHIQEPSGMDLMIGHDCTVSLAAPTRKGQFFHYDRKKIFDAD